ncbi:hypothetical protein ACP70R_005223 [Stipagrostis hirtigluma subsp. patula]
MMAAEGEGGAPVKDKGEEGAMAAEKSGLAAVGKVINGDEQQLITLKSSDGMAFEVSAAAAKLSVILDAMIETGCVVDGPISLRNITALTLEKVVAYCQKHSEAEVKSGEKLMSDDATNEIGSHDPNEDVKTWDEYFISNLGQEGLLAVILAADYLEIEQLLDAACHKAADMIKGKTPDEIRASFNLNNDFNPEEERLMAQEHGWAYDERCSV